MDGEGVNIKTTMEELASYMRGWRGDLQVPAEFQPTGNFNTPIIVAGDSHMCALVGDLYTTEPQLHAVAGFPNVYALHASWPRRKTYWEHLKANCAGARIALVWRGNEHNVHYFFQNDRPFDFVSRHVNLLIHTFNIIPQKMVRQKFKATSFDVLRAVLSSLVSGSAEGIGIVGTPPPKKDSEQLRKLLLNEPVFQQWAERLGASIDTVKITSPHVRLKLWFLIQEMLGQVATEIGAKFISVPAELQDADGFLRPEYWHADVTHANRIYGEVMLRRVVEQLG
jgi:hypothetical protein